MQIASVLSSVVERERTTTERRQQRFSERFRKEIARKTSGQHPATVYTLRGRDRRVHAPHRTVCGATNKSASDFFVSTPFLQFGHNTHQNTQNDYNRRRNIITFMLYVRWKFDFHVFSVYYYNLLLLLFLLLPMPLAHHNLYKYNMTNTSLLYFYATIKVLTLNSIFLTTPFPRFLIII